MAKLPTTFPLLLAGLCCVPAVARADTVSLLLDAGLLKNGAGTALEPAGGLLQLIASPTGTFAPPTSLGYVGGDNVLLRSFPMDYYSGTNGETVNALYSIPFVTPTYMVTAGEPILLRFYPGLTYAGLPAAPTAGSAYGQVRSNTIEFGVAGGDAAETPWVLPGGGSTVDLDYITRGDGGTYADATADATGTVRQVLTLRDNRATTVTPSVFNPGGGGPLGGAALLPEPTTVPALATVTAIATAGLGRRRRTARAVA